jgi:hypothetical protein
MVPYCALAILALLVGINADTQPCSRQIEAEMQCMLTVVTSTEAQTLKDRVKQVVKTCAPSIPDECHAQKDAMMQCGTEIMKSADSDPQFQESKKISQPAVDQCFVQNPPDVKKAFEEIFMNHMGPKHGKHGHKRGSHGHKRHNSTSSESSGGSSGEQSSGESSGEFGKGNSTSASGSRERRHHRGCRHGRPHGQKNATSASGSKSQSRERNTSGKGSSSKGSSSKGKSSKGKSSGGKQHHEIPPQCRKTKEQKKCIKEGIRALGNDTVLVDTINTLVNQKRKCKQLVTWSCTAKCSKRQKCIFKATKTCRQVFMQKFETCLKQKGFTLPPFMLKKAHEEMLTTPLPGVTQ